MTILKKSVTSYLPIIFRAILSLMRLAKWNQTKRKNKTQQIQLKCFLAFDPKSSCNSLLLLLKTIKYKKIGTLKLLNSLGLSISLLIIYLKKKKKSLHQQMIIVEGGLVTGLCVKILIIFLEPLNLAYLLSVMKLQHVFQIQ